MTAISTNDTAQLGVIRSCTGPLRHGAEQRTGATYGWERLRDKPRVRLWFGSGMCRISGVHELREVRVQIGLVFLAPGLWVLVKMKNILTLEPVLMQFPSHLPKHGYTEEGAEGLAQLQGLSVVT